MRLRELRHRLTPALLGTEARRQHRNNLYRRLGIERCYTPPLVTRRPEILVRSVLPFVVAHELLANPQMTFMQIGAFDGQGDDDEGPRVHCRRITPPGDMESRQAPKGSGRLGARPARGTAGAPRIDQIRRGGFRA